MIRLLSVMRYFLCFLVLGFVVAPARAQERAPKFYAVVVGISNYEGSLALKAKLDEGAAQVKVALEQYARKAGYHEKNVNVSLHVDRDPKTPTIPPHLILTYVHEASIKTQDTRDTFVFFFTGHGSFTKGKMWLYASKSQEGNDSNYVEFQRIIDKFAQSKAATKLLFIDACQILVDPSALGDGPVLYGMNMKEMSELLPQGTAIFYASSKGMPAHIDFSVGFGYFTKHLVAVLSGSGTESVSANGLRYASQLDEYFKRVVPKDVADKEKREQEPYATLDGKLAFDLMPLVPASPVRACKKESDEVSVPTIINGVVAWSKQCLD